MDPERPSGEFEPESGSSRFQLAARRAQGQMTDAAWWQLSARERVRSIYEQLRHLDEMPAETVDASAPMPETPSGADKVVSD